MAILTASWLVGSRGLFTGRPPGPWTRLSARQFPVLSLCRSAAACYVGVTGGLWEIRGSTWTQRHDETLTEVLAVCLTQGDPGVLAGSPYGVATPSLSRGGAWRWSFIDSGLSPDERFTSSLLADPADKTLVWVGTEAGLYSLDLEGRRIRPTSLAGTPVRALASANGSLWAGTDTRGVWKRDSSGRWNPAGAGLAVDAVFSLAATGDGRLLAGTSRGVAVGDGSGSWKVGGPRILVSALAAAEDAGAAGRTVWLAGASPGGLWYSASRTDEWTNVPGHAYVRALAAPLAPAPKEKA